MSDTPELPKDYDLGAVIDEWTGDGTPGPAREAALTDAEVEAVSWFFQYGATRGNHSDEGRGPSPGPLTPHIDAMASAMRKIRVLGSGDSGGPREAGDKVSHDGMFDPSEVEACEEWTQAKDDVQAALMFIRHCAETFRDNAREHDKDGRIHEATADFAMAALYDEVAAEGEKGFAALRAELGRAGTEPIKRESYRCPRCGSREWRGDVCEGCAFDRARADAERREPAP